MEIVTNFINITLKTLYLNVLQTMFRMCTRTLVNRKLEQALKLHKRSKYRNATVLLIKTLTTQRNLTFSHAIFLKKIHTNSHLRARIFRDSENSYAYNILQTIPITNQEAFNFMSPRMKITTSNDFNELLDQNWRSKSASEIVEGFQSALNYCVGNNINVSDARFDKLVDGLMDHVQDLTDSELLELLNCLEKYPLCDSFSSHNFHDIWSALDDICCWKMANWSNETRFLFAEHWYRLNLGKVSDFMYHFIDRLQKRLKFITKNEVVHLFFYLKVHKRHQLRFEFQNALNEHIRDMSLEEMAIVTMAFVPSKTKINSLATAEIMVNKLKQELPTANEICVRRIVEVLRYSSHVLLTDQLLDLLTHLVPEIDRLSNLCCIHIALLGTTLQFFHEVSLEKVSEKILKSITDPNEIRLKDLERILVPLTMFDYNPKTSQDIFEAIFKEIHTEERRKEVVKYPRCLPSALNLLSMRNLYSHEFMNEILDMDSIFEIYGKSPKTLQRDIFCLDVCIDVECPDYKGKRLDKVYRQKAAKWTVEYTPSWDQHKKISAAEKFTLDVMDVVAKVVGGHQNFHADHVLPNFVKSDIIVCKDENGKFVPPPGFESYTLGDVMRPLNQNLKWFAVIPVNWNNLIRNAPSKPLGIINMKCRQLKKIGYEPILVMWNEFSTMQEKEQIAHIENKIR